jgi:hypothetical protein
VDRSAWQVRAVDASGANTTGTVYFTVLGEARSSSSNNKAAAVAAIVAASVVVLGVLICLVLVRPHDRRAARAHRAPLRWHGCVRAPMTRHTPALDQSTCCGDRHNCNIFTLT